ncbi:hypothetical protein [Actinoplanes teichomyceticus]|nr:hypothetical protein [Actinoplanes teichomyceticus]
MTAISRRCLLLSATVGAGAALATSGAVAAQGANAAGVQYYWGFSNTCYAMFFFGHPTTTGVCPAGGGHVYAGYNFGLPHDVAPSEHAQGDWRNCADCQVMFYRGCPDKGRCAAGGGHIMAGYDFVLPHDVTPPPNHQPDWRYRRKYKSLFFDGYEQKERCLAGGGHRQQGYMFVLPYL